MEKVALPICSRCRMFLWPKPRTIILARQLHTPASKTRSHPAFPPIHDGRPPRKLKYVHDPSLNPRRYRERDPEDVARTVTLEDVPKELAKHVHSWAKDKKVQNRFHSFGIPQNECSSLLRRFSEAVEAEKAFIASHYHEDMLEIFTRRLSNPSHIVNIDRVISKIFYTWATKSKTRLAKEGIAESTLDQMENILRAGDYSYPAEWFPDARNMKRKFIMHVGPTNSGKTHNALRALAAARSGCYAGPLRLLAYEIADRLNKGQIVPRSAEVTKDLEMDLNASLDIGAPVVMASQNEKYAKPCNLITGELRIIVDNDAPIASCTVEMVNMARLYDVAVVDEIQMIADEYRGAAWTFAVLGLRAKEIHLCGEETAVPIIQAILRDTGDELVINRYERLSPLTVADKSLEGDLTRLQPGDCIVAFQRSTILELKNRVEKETGLRAAVVYGRLPPELRSAQAALFNEPGSGYDVLIGSDAIGMGLNLKIKRIIFSDMNKFDGKRYLPLSVSQTKQIAGRAGRFGLHDDSNAGGIVTTLYEGDLKALRRTMAKTIPSLKCAYLRSSSLRLEALYEQLPPGTQVSALTDAATYLSMYRQPYELEVLRLSEVLLRMVNTLGNIVPLDERLLLTQLPVSHNDELAEEYVQRLVQLFRETGKVEIKALLEKTSMFNVLAQVSHSMQSGENIAGPVNSLKPLESLDKCIGAYLWLTYRNPVVFPDNEIATRLKGRTELAIDACLKAMNAQKRQSNAKEPRRRQRENKEKEETFFFERLRRL